jgi:hypothetical protein
MRVTEQECQEGKWFCEENGSEKIFLLIDNSKTPLGALRYDDISYIDMLPGICLSIYLFTVPSRCYSV